MPVVTDGGRGVGVEALGTNYPFVSPSNDVTGLLADFYLAHEVRTAVLPLRISWLYGFCRGQSECGSSSSRSSDSPDPVHDADLVVKDAEGAVVFDSTTAPTFRSRPWGNRFHLFEWQTATAVCRALVHKGASDPEQARVFDIEIVPENGVLDERTVELIPKRVLRFEVNGEVFDGNVEFAQGYNIGLTRTVPVGKSIRARNRIIVSAAPGDGEGRYPSCEEPERVVRRINGTGPNPQGDFLMSASGCYWIERPVLEQGSEARVMPAAVRLNNNCGPCCECADYEKTYQGVRRLHGRYKDLGRRAENVRGLFKKNKERWLKEQGCRKQHPTRVVAAAAPLGYLDVAASFCNVDDDCKYELDLKIKVTHNNLANPKTITLVPYVTIVSRSTGGIERKELYYEGANTWGNYWAFVGPGRALTMRTRFRVANVEDGDSVTVVVTPYIAGITQLPAVTTVSLYPYGA